MCVEYQNSGFKLLWIDCWHYSYDTTIPRPFSIDTPSFFKLIIFLKIKNNICTNIKHNKLYISNKVKRTRHLHSKVSHNTIWHFVKLFKVIFLVLVKELFKSWPKNSMKQENQWNKKIKFTLFLKYRPKFHRNYNKYACYASLTLYNKQRSEGRPIIVNSTWYVNIFVLHGTNLKVVIIINYNYLNPNK